MTDKTAVTIQLEYPLEFAEEEITEIKLRRATGKDLKLAMKGVNAVQDSIALAVRLSGHLPAVFDMMDASDLTEVLSQVGNLLQSGQKTG
jgi:hypothetical protein